MAVYDFPEGVAGVMSSGVFGYVSERDPVVEKISHIVLNSKTKKVEGIKK
jgi:hypothetical protein